MAFQQNAFQHNAFQVGLGPAVAAPQRLYLWRPLAVVALGLLAVEDYGQPDNNRLHAHRGSSAHGLAPASYSQVVLVEAEQDPVRTDHSRRLFFGRSAAAAPTATTPWFQVARKAQVLLEEEEQPRRKTPDLHAFRWEPTVRGVFFYSKTAVDLTVEPDPYRTDHSLHRYRSPPVATPTVGAPWYLWPRPPAVRVEPEDDARRLDGTLLHRYRVGYQTVGQPWHLWKPAVADQTTPEDAQRTDHTRLHRYRVGYQTVGQPWAYWIKPQARIDEEVYVVPGPPSLSPYRQITTTVQPGQPWWAWPAAKADQTVEPNPVVTDHAAALYPFRPHEAVTPPEPPVVEPSTNARGKWQTTRNYIIKGKRYFGLTELQLALVLAQEFGPNVERKQVQVAFKGKKPHPVSVQAWQDILESMSVAAVRQIDDDDDEAAAMLLL